MTIKGKNLVVTTLLISGLLSLPSLAGEKVPLEVLPADQTVLTDSATGAKLTFLTTQTPSSNLYFHERSWLADSSMILFRGHRGLMGYLPETGELVVLSTPVGSVSKATAAAGRNSIFCMRGNDVLELAVNIHVSSDLEAAPSSVVVDERLITTLRSPGQLNVNYDDHFLSVGLKGDSPSINVIEVASGKVREICKVEPPLQWKGHLQWSHSNSNLLSFAGGDDWHQASSADRIWVVDPKEGVPRSVHSQIEGELVTHESWWVNDQILYCGAPPTLGFEETHKKRETSHVNLLDPKTGTVRILGAGAWWPGGTDAEIWKRNWWHCAGSSNGRWVVADNPHGDLVLFEATTTRPRLLTAGHRTYGGGAHAHPGWDRKGEQVIFASHQLSNQANACVVTIPQSWQVADSAPDAGGTQ